MKKFNAFTMAEVLLTLLIIAVIATMTVPALKKDAAARTVATSLNKIYSELSQATQLALSKSAVNKLSRTDFFTDEETFHNKFVKEYFSVARECPAGTPEDCFGNSNLVAGRSVLLTNGFGLAFLYNNTGSMIVYVDVNGPKSPNKGGSDQFILNVDNSGTVHTGLGNQSKYDTYSQKCVEGTDDYELAWSCAVKIQQDGWNIKF